MGGEGRKMEIREEWKGKGKGGKGKKEARTVFKM